MSIERMAFTAIQQQILQKWRHLVTNSLEEMGGLSVLTIEGGKGIGIGSWGGGEGGESGNEDVPRQERKER